MKIFRLLILITCWMGNDAWGVAKSKELSTTINGVKFAFVQIRPGTFMMGTEKIDSAEKPKHIDPMPVHPVKISKPFQMGKYEVTMEQWDALMEKNPSRRKGKGENLPVDSVSWEEVQEFIGRLNQKDTGHHYRLPTEAEWEYTCRAGQKGDFHGDLNEIAWWEGNSGNVWKNLNQPGEKLEGPKMPLPVGSKKPNAWGLHDMQGNVWEWVQDWYGSYSKGSDTDPQGPPSGTVRVFKGGSWLSWGFHKEELRPSYRDCRQPGFRHTDLGFRLVRTAR